MHLPFRPPPPGSIFEVGHSDDGAFVVRYPAEFDRGALVFWLLWTAVAVYCTVHVPPPVPLPGVAALWAGNALWLFMTIRAGIMTTTLLFKVDQLIIQKRGPWYCRLRTIPRREIREIREIDDVREDSDSPPGWSLVLLAGEEIRLLSSVPRHETRWLSSLLARWAGVPVVP